MYFGVLGYLRRAESGAFHPTALPEGRGSRDEHRVPSAVPGLRPADAGRGRRRPGVCDLPADLPRSDGSPVPGGCSDRTVRSPWRGPSTSDDPDTVVRIAQVAPLYEAVPPGAYGGTERVIATLCDGLVAQGHEVTLFAPEDVGDGRRCWRRSASRCASGSAARSWSTSPRTCTCRCWPSSTSGQTTSTSCTPTSTSGPFPSPASSEVPTVLTMHGRLDLDFLRDLLPRYGVGAAGLHQRRPAAGGGGPRPDLGGHGVQRPRPLGVPRRAARPRRLPRLRRPDRRGEGTARGDRDRPPIGAPAPDGRQGRPARRGLLRGRGEARDGPRTSTSSGRSRSTRSPTSTAVRGPPCSPATGRSRSAW